ncbi:MAG: thioredoxin family protein [Lachnospiraceae bacterium]|nr:thioredoxin family protein [Lachnospiraceae bacterium]
MAIQYATNENYKELISNGLVIVDFFSTTCVPCKMFSVILEDLEGELPFVNVVKVNTTDYPEIGKENHIEAVPTIMFYKNGELLETNIGIIEYDDLKKKIAAYMY